MARKGLPASYIRAAWKTKGATKKNALKRAWAAYKGKKSKKSSSTKKSKKSKSKSKGGSVKRMGKRGFSNQTIFKFIRLGALVAPGAIRYAKTSGSAGQKIGNALLGYSGMQRDGKFDGGLLAQMWTPYVMSVLTTHGIPKLTGIIRRL